MRVIAVIFEYKDIVFLLYAQIETQDSDDDYEEGMCLEEDHAEQSIVGNSYGEDFAGFQDDELGQLQEIEGLGGEDGEIHCEQAVSELPLFFGTVVAQPILYRIR